MVTGTHQMFGLFTVPGLYKSDTGTISDKYNTKITPSGSTFTIWAFIYTWQLTHVVYSLTLLCRKNSDGQYLYLRPGHIHFSFYIVFMINNAFNIGWIFLFDRELMEVALVFLILIAVTLYICGVIVCRSLYQAGGELERLKTVKDIWLTRLLLINGLAFYGTWCTIATLLNLSIVLQYKASVDQYVCAWIALGVLTAELLAWFILETFVFDRHLRYCFSPYIVLLVAFSGVITKHYDASSPEPYLYFVFALLAVSGVLAIVKIIIMIVKGIKMPIQYQSSRVEPTLTTEEQAAKNAI